MPLYNPNPAGTEEETVWVVTDIGRIVEVLKYTSPESVALHQQRNSATDRADFPLKPGKKPDVGGIIGWRFATTEEIARKKAEDAKAHAVIKQRVQREHDRMERRKGLLPVAAETK